MHLKLITALAVTTLAVSSTPSLLAGTPPLSISQLPTSRVSNPSYNNAQIRSILNGFGFTDAPETGADFPLTSDNGVLNDRVSVKAIKAFQKRYRLKVTGRTNAQTLRELERVMKTLHQQLNEFMGANLLLEHPNYDERTIGVVRIFQHQLGSAIQDGIARESDRQQLQKLSDSHSHSSNNMGN